MIDFRVTTIQSLSTVTQPAALSSKNFLILSKIDTYNGLPGPSFQVYKISESVLLHGHKPTIVDAAKVEAVINGIYANFNELSSKMQNRGTPEDKTGMMDEAGGYMLVREVANNIAKMIREEDIEEIADKFVEDNEVSAVEAELYAKGEELAQEVMDYAGALGMALITAHAPVGADAEEAPSATV